MNTDFNALLNKAGNLLLLLMGMESLCLLICDTFGLSFSIQSGLSLALMCIFLWLTTCFKRGFLFGLPLLFVVLYLTYHEGYGAFQSTIQTFAERIVNRYLVHFGGTAAASDGETAVDVSSALLSILYLLSSFVAFSLTLGSFRVSLSRLSILPFFIACILVNGTPPVLPILGILLFCLGVQLGGDSFRLTDGAGKSLLFGLLPCALVLTGLLLLYRPSTYQYDQNDISLSKRFDQFSNLLSGWIGGGTNSQESSSLNGAESDLPVSQAPAGWNRSQDQLDLTRPFDFNALSQGAMTFQSDASGTVYLRGQSYGDYLGTAWNAAVDNQHVSALDYTARSLASPDNSGLGTHQYQFEIDTANTYSLLYLPYFNITGVLGDISVPANDLKNYGGSYFRSQDDLLSYRGPLLPQSVFTEEEQYRQYVHSYYTRLPDSTRLALDQVCIDNGLSADQDNIISKVASFVRNQGIYDLAVESYPDSDYAVYFLTVSHRGYCIHYATAAVALLRTLNIPARICEGYLVNSVPGTSIRVSGENAHAWAEVYLDGIGWIPVEVTASEADTSQTPELGNSEASSGQTAASNSDETNIDPLSDPETAKVEDSASAPEDQATLLDPNQKTSQLLQLIFKILLLLVAFPGVVILLLYTRYRWLRYRRKWLLESAEQSQKAILIYRWAHRLTDYGAEIPEEIRIPAEKAAFSQHSISDEELQKSYQSLIHLTQDTYSLLGKKHKLVFRYLAGNI